MASGPRTKLTKAIIDSVPSPPAGPRRIWEPTVPGLHLRTTERGVRTWYVKYRTEDGAQKEFKIGRYPDLVPNAARERALKVVADVANGKDPAGEKSAKRKAPRMSDLCDRFMDEYVRRKLKPSTQSTYECLIRLHIKPRLGKKRVEEVTTADVQSLHTAMASTARNANFTVAVIRKMMEWAVTAGLRDDTQNPAARVGRYRENKRNRFLSETEFAHLWQVLDEVESEGQRTDAVLAIRLLLLTGRRRGEILGLRWENVDLDAGRLRLSDSKVGAYTFNLAPEVVQLLSEEKRRRGQSAGAGGYVIRGRDPDCPLQGLQKFWERLRKRAGIPDVRLHDLRHTYASFAAAAGYDLLRIKEMLGHRTIQTTQRYAHLTDRAVRESVERLGGQLMALTRQNDAQQIRAGD